MKRLKKVFGMTDHELRSTLNSVLPEGSYLMMTKSDMQEELINWGLTVAHEFLLYEDEDGVVWLLDKGNGHCQCCQTQDKQIDGPLHDQKQQKQQQKQRQSPFEVVIYRDAPHNHAKNNKVAPAELSVTKLHAEFADHAFSRPFSNDGKKHVKETVITQQPLPSKQKVPNPKPPDERDSRKGEAKRGSCKSCCIECGTCCVGLLNSS